MNQPKIRFALLCTTVLLLLTSCSNTGNSHTETTDGTVRTDTVQTKTAPAPSNIVTTPENIIVVRYKVSDYAKWRAQYDSRDSMRLANGVHNYVLGRSVKDPNAVLVAVKADDMTKAKAFAKSPALKSAMQKGFVVGTPTYTFTTVVYQDMSPNLSDLRSMNFFQVKDWDRWQKAFDSGRQWRMQNGLTDRAYGHDVDDNHKVVMVAAINDSAKAEAYWKSDSLKSRRKAAGVVGDVERFVYRVVQKY